MAETANRVFSVELPDRRVLDIEAPDEATALRTAGDWHRANPQPELSAAETAADVATRGMGGINRFAANALMLPWRASAWLTGTQGRGFEGAGQQALDPWLNQPIPQSRAGRYAEAVGEFAGGAIPVAGVALRAARTLPMVAPATEGVINTLVRPFATNPGAMVGIDAVASAAGGSAHEAAREAGAGHTGQALAGLAGGFAGPLAAVPLAVGARRGIEAMGEAAVNRLGIRASADGSIPNVPPSTQEAAEQVLADTLLRAGIRTPQLHAALERIGEARRFWSQGRAQDVTALADLDESLMRLAGSLARQHPEAARIIRQFIQARQTGHTPEGLEAIDLAERGLPTRSRFSDPITGAQAEKQLGRRFDTPEGGYVPMGMVESTRDATRRAFLISDAEYHGHGLTGLRTEQRIVKTADDAARTNYNSAYTAGKGVNLRASITPVFERHIAEAAANEAPAVENTLKNMQRIFRSGPIELKQFDRTKRYLDDKIKGYLNRPTRDAKTIGGALNAMKNDLLAAVDSIETNGVGAAYKSARNAYSSEMEMLNALKLGRQALREDSEVTADAFNALTTDGERKLFRLGLLDSITERGQNMPRGHDFTKVFKTPRVEEILSATIPKSQGKHDTFADRPVRFGRYLENQSRMIENRNVTQGGSTTARNLADDQALETLQAAALREVGSVIDTFRGSQSLWQFGQRAVELALDKAFGLRADVAESLAHMLFTADPAARMQILNNVAQRMGPSRMARFNELMQQYQQAATASGSANIGALTAPAQQQNQQ